MISLKTFAKLVGTSPSTVSFVLNGRAEEMRISKAVSNRILQKARELSYRPNTIAVALRTGQTKVIGLIVEDIANQFFSSLARTIEEELNTFDYKVVYCSLKNHHKKEADLVQLMKHQRVDGFLVTPTAEMELSLRDIDINKTPVVQIDRYLPELHYPYVLVDNYKGIVSGADYLVKKGKKKIGLITVGIDLVQMKDRETAFVDTLTRSKLAADLVLRVPYNSADIDTIRLIQDFLALHVPDAILFTTNYLGISGLKAIRNLQLRVPEQLSVLCFDDNIMFDLLSPSVTAIRQPVASIAQTAVRILMGELGVIDKVEKRMVLMEPQIIFRESV
ncbi:LacI family DNA-binding transcriptional regulator [Niabella beijingensis]|uniref:LacI family DNA-binding transcriptional regulator n=1 Tax=Niabella beijingensis TaxID=2872700 RepID=UPI001CBCD369|nr:substrate-binding domain-containing protein [Niabella beijingensis]MBZ4192279.1 substrate-binding domain-containing protein [Niabella beijingensis]